VAEKRSLDVAIIGAGMSGLCMAAKLQDAGIHAYTIFETADEVGGTWRDNTYPGLSCDVPSRFYSYSFRPNPDWSRLMSPGPEIQAYFRQVATERGCQLLGVEWSVVEFLSDVKSVGWLLCWC
jgi:cation diffusion facilitator CzcD-associated flavoprotein CzcO